MASIPEAELLTLFEVRITEQLRDDPMSKALNRAIHHATQALHSRQSELVARMKGSMGLEGHTTFESLLEEQQMGVH